MTRVKRDYQAKQFIERGPDQIELQVQSDGDFRGTVHQKPDCLYTGLRFRIYVEAPVSESDDLDYHLRLGTAELTRVSVTGDDSRTVFLTIDEWETRFEDRDEEQFAERARARILGDEEGDISPFAKIAEAERINEFGIDEWRAIYDWANSDTSNLS
ncbi:hypothetical protein [Haloarchaeobius iranensis]|uniref:hypothetical protein n=1 Tax=Haloarchaeobius iranensis TaxID=996166 RepID=UPI0015879CC0|nr:hypothetical protein [Haloarchaeobius iranensis]